ncbi:uncharacterized protein PFLUO_LOCUS8557 [Penicillium psychrofluorescens]|uniref:uncharacterized protein n=1 Tax=Penicillium psychrofluorescens TaxID=3158075 RepID=UPI003CCDE2AC
MAETAQLPSANPVELAVNATLQPPLSRCGHGPGLILLRPACYAGCQQDNKSLDPEPLQKWAEESFAVVQITIDVQSSKDLATLLALIKTAKDGLTALPECDQGKFGLIVYGSKSDYDPEFEDGLCEILAVDNPEAVVYFDSWNTPDRPVSMLHASLPVEDPPQSDKAQVVHVYPDISSPAFTIPGHPKFKISTAGVAHTRSVAFIKKHLNGPYFDLEKIWDEHTYYEFGDRSVEKTMATMVQEPYVNHVPTLTGGIGRARLSHFYLNHFIFANPDDTALELISRTVGSDRIVDEFIFCLTHEKHIPWLIPGVPPTGKPLRIPFTSVVNIRGDRLYHEHIAWDQATVLVQLGLMPEYLPFPYALPDGKLPAPGKRFEYRVPAAGVESAQKLENEHEVPSNEMFAYKIREVMDR